MTGLQQPLLRRCGTRGKHPHELGGAMTYSVLHVGVGTPLDSERLAVTQVTEPDEAIDRAIHESFEAVVLDLTVADAPLVVRRLRQSVAAAAIIVRAADEHSGEARDLLRHGADDYVLGAEASASVLVHAIRAARDRLRLDDGPDRQGLVGPLLFHDRLEGAIVRAGRSRDPLAVMAATLDGFIRTEAAHGRNVAEAALAGTALRIRNALRDADTVCRPAGDTLLLLLERVGSRADARRALQRVQGAVNTELMAAGVRLVPTVSIGAAIWPDHALTATDLVAAASRALRRAQSEGAAMVRFAAMGRTRPVDLATVSDPRLSRPATARR